MANGIIVSHNISFNTKPKLELETLNGYGLTIASGSNVSKWNNYGTIKNYFINDTPSAQPVVASYTQGKVLSFDGGDSLVYNGAVNDFNFLNGVASCEFACAFRPSNLASDRVLFYTATQDSERGVKVSLLTSGAVRIDVYAEEVASLYTMTSASSVITVNNWHWLRWYIDFTNNTGYLVVNGTTYGPFSKNANTPATICTFAANIGSNYIGYIGNIQAYNRLLTTGERIDLNNYFSDVYDFAT